ncbi:uncharacterized protein LOC125496009 [Beta vulgaris subsp. vulgaris]|uniref:uncharacterized protein LOC125496009 n=1 Tax=Beta vulgaris subsp. vulgaris TaxID=3555 RepID=UPI0020368D41|nr:uncharacterized protein LOC125496009 [Beta vulgaris subsp. vulgaris]
MADKLSHAAMRAARLRAELKEKSLGVPPPPKDPSKPKASEKRKERAAEKVAQTEKAVAKSQAERAKKAKSIKVNNPRDEAPATLAEGNDISLHSSDFKPVGSPQYTPASPRPALLDDPEAVNLALAKPFKELDIRDLDSRWTNAIDYLYGPTDQEYINNANDDNETENLFRSWVEVSFDCFFSTWLLSDHPPFFLVLCSVGQCCQEQGSLG